MNPSSELNFPYIFARGNDPISKEEGFVRPLLTAMTQVLPYQKKTFLTEDLPRDPISRDVPTRIGGQEQNAAPGTKLLSGISQGRGF